MIIQVLSFNELVRRPSLLKKLSELTLCGYSGMSEELEFMRSNYKKKQINCKVFVLRHKSKVIGWSILTKERGSNFLFKYRTNDLPVYETYIHPNFRRMGFGLKLLNLAKQRSGVKQIGVFGLDDTSTAFFKRKGLIDLNLHSCSSSF